MLTKNDSVFTVSVTEYKIIVDVKRTVAKTVYNIASNSARSFIRSNISEFRLGGPGIVVLVDTFPDIHSNIAPQEYNSKSRLILCIAEIKARHCCCNC